MKKIIELIPVYQSWDNEDNKIWVVKMITSNNGYSEETWTRPGDAFEENAVWREVRNFVEENRKDYKALSYYLKENGFTIENKECEIYPTYWDFEINGWKWMKEDEYLVYAGRTVTRK